VNVLVRSKDRTALTATLDFPPNTLQPGWTLIVEEPESQSSQKEDLCERSKPASHPFSVKVVDDEGKRVRQFENEIDLAAFASHPPASSKNLGGCFSFRDDEDEESDWDCIDQELAWTDVQTPGVSFARGRIPHFTSFAVLLGSPWACGWTWITIASTAMIGSSICLILFLGVLYSRSKTVQACVAGFEPERRITRALQKINVRIPRAQT
jgi:hypothetical protein